MDINQTEFKGKDHLQKDGLYTLDLRQKATLHQALKMMIGDENKFKPFDGLRRQLKQKNALNENYSFPLDLSQGNILQQAIQIMNGEI